MLTALVALMHQAAAMDPRGSVARQSGYSCAAHRSKTSSPTSFAGVAETRRAEAERLYAAFQRFRPCQRCGIDGPERLRPRPHRFLHLPRMPPPGRDRPLGAARPRARPRGSRRRRGRRRDRRVDRCQRVGHGWRSRDDASVPRALPSALRHPRVDGRVHLVRHLDPSAEWICSQCGQKIAHLCRPSSRAHRRPRGRIDGMSRLAVFCPALAGAASSPRPTVAAAITRPTRSRLRLGRDRRSCNPDGKPGSADGSVDKTTAA